MKPSPDPTVRWGDQRILTFGPILQSTSATSELLRVDLDGDPTTKRIASRQCKVNFHAEVISQGATGVVGTLLVELQIGNGSMMTKVRRRYSGLPQVSTAPGAPGVPLDVSWEYALTHIRGRVAMTAIDCLVEFSLWLAPVSWSVEELERR